MLDRVLAVIDLQRGRAVRGVAGKRDRYQPVTLERQECSDPLALAQFYRSQGVGGLYVADLDALTCGDVQPAAIRDIAALGCPLWLDAGIRGGEVPSGLYDLLALPHVHWILATETCGCDPSIASSWLARLPPERLTISIDLMRGRLLVPAGQGELTQRGKTGDLGAGQEEAREMPARDDAAPSPAETAIAGFYALGCRSFLLLDLAAVGSGQGPRLLSLCRSLRQRYPEIALISGGGVRDRDDLQRFYAAGVERVLVASALQNGAIFARRKRGKD